MNFLSAKHFSKLLYLWARRAPSLRLTYKVYIFLGGSSRLSVLLSSKTASSSLTGLAEDMNVNLLFVTLES